MKSFTLQLLFPKSPSPQFPRALAIAECAYKFSTAGEGRNAFYISIFDNNIEQLNLFQKLFQIVRSWKGISIEINNMPVKPWEISKTLECYMRSLLCRDYRAYCWLFGIDAKEESRRLALSVSMSDTMDDILEGYEEALEGDDPMVRIKRRHQEMEIEDKPKTYIPLSPCQYIHPLKVGGHHPSSLEDQFQAEAVKQGVWWCPHFRMEGFR